MQKILYPEREKWTRILERPENKGEDLDKVCKAVSTMTQEKALYEIHMQQWIDLMDRPFEEFVQWRRSGTAGNEVPTLQVPEDATSKELIRRWEYSPEEMTANINAPKESPKIWEKLWFDL